MKVNLRQITTTQMYLQLYSVSILQTNLRYYNCNFTILNINESKKYILNDFTKLIPYTDLYQLQFLFDFIIDICKLLNRKSFLPITALQN